MTGFIGRFDGAELDLAVWLPAYMPAWSSRHDARATYRLDDEGLHLTIPEDHPRWCADTHRPPLKVSGVQSGNWSGPLGGTRGQQPFADGLVVREEQPTFRGLVPYHGRIEVECRAVIDGSSMFSAWMVGMEDERARCGEICLMEVFGDTIADDGTAAVGSGIHPFRDPSLTEEFSADRRAIDVGDWHSYAVEWRPDGVDWFHDGELVRSSAQSPGYEMLLILAVFEFPGRAPRTVTPELVVRRVAVDS